MNTIAVHSKDDGAAHEVNSPKNQAQFLYIIMEQYWLGKTKPKQAFKLKQNAFKELLIFNGIFYWLTDWLPDTFR